MKAWENRGKWLICDKIGNEADALCMLLPLTFAAQSTCELPSLIFPPST